MKISKLFCLILGHKVVGYVPWDGRHWHPLFYYCIRCGKEVNNADNPETEADSDA